MDEGTIEEIVSILAKNGRPDLIAEFNEVVRVDNDYKPPKRIKRDSLSESEGSAESEEDYQIHEDENGFLSLA
mgnify:CR=1 FL=1|tara:strand:+ start:212 stop:430 length:219 start_codon:yes stop_codon:yes gene_type:complete